MTTRQKIILQLGDFIIPLLGFYYLDWSIYFIAIYLLLDVLGSFIFYNVKARKRIRFSKDSTEQSTYSKSAVAFFLIIISLITITHLFTLNVIPNIHFKTEFVQFLMYVEPPIPLPQFWFLIPLILLPPYQEYKMVFITQQKFRKTSMKELRSTYQLDLFAALALLGIITGISYFIQLPHELWLFSYLGMSLFYSLYLKSQIPKPKK